MCDYEGVFESQLSESVRLPFDNERFDKVRKIKCLYFSCLRLYSLLA